jgi:hypothetical protein
MSILRIVSSLDSSINLESCRNTLTGVGGFFIPDGEPDFNRAAAYTGVFN